MNNTIAMLCCSAMLLSAQVTTTISPARWVGVEFGTESGTISLTNKTATQRQIDGVRVTVPNASLTQITSQGSWETGFEVKDGSTASRFDMLIGTRSGGEVNDNLPINILNPNKMQTYGLYTSSVGKDAEWTPKDPQILVIGGKSLAEKKVNKDITGITLKQLDSISKTPDFYNAKLYVPDTLGIRGSAWGAGFIDTWVDQETGVPFWQIQVCDIPFVDKGVSPPDTFRFWNEHKAFFPDSLDVNDANYGVKNGPFYMMGLALTQEYMNVDMQSLIAKGFQESNAGLSMGYVKETKGYPDTLWDTVQVLKGVPPVWSWSIAPSLKVGDIVSFNGKYYKALVNAPTISADPVSWNWASQWVSTTYTGGNTYVDSIFVDSTFWHPSSYDVAFDYVKYTNRTANGATSMGPMHYEESTYKGQIFEPYPKFFPFENGVYQNSSKFIDASTGGSPLNHPSIVNAYLISTLNMWYSWQLVVASLGQDALDKMKSTPNRRLMSDLVNYAWNQGVNGNYKQAFEAGGINFIYIDQINNGIQHLEDANRKSVLNGGDRPVYDAAISRIAIEQLFFGEGGSGSAGTLGKSGLLHHFNLTEAERKVLWSEVDSAYTMLKGRAPSTKGSDKISYRYDYLAILRIAKKFLDLTIPVPKTEIFKNWTTTTTTTPIDRIAPFCSPELQKKATSANSRFVKEWIVGDSANIPDSAGVRSVEWTIDLQWRSWNDAASVSSTKYKLDVAQADMNALIPSGSDTVTAWVRITDRNENSLIDTFSVWRSVVTIDTTKKWTAPIADSARAIDTNGDGNADQIELFLRTDSGYDLNKISGINRVWPAGSSSVAESKWTVSSSKIILNPAGLTGGSGEGNLSFSFPEKSGYSVKIVDRVGAVIKSAVRLKRADDLAKDTLVLAVSETVNSAKAADLLRIRSGESKMTAESAQFSGTSVRLVLPRNSFVSNDSVRFDPAGSVLDGAGNAPHGKNPAVAIKLELDDATSVPVSIVGGMYDSNGDGKADSAVISMKLASSAKRFTANDLKKMTISWPKGAAITDASARVLNDSTIVFTGFTSSVCAGEGELMGFFADSLTVIRPIEDRVGPVVKSAVRKKWGDSSAKDTLVLTLSESITGTASDSLIELIRLGSSRPTVESIVVKGDSATFVLKRATVAEGDSVRLVPQGTVRDLAGNGAHKANPAVIITVIGEQRPSVSAAYFDRTGDGLPDSIRIDLTLGTDKNRFTAKDLSTVTATLPEGTSAAGTVKVLNDSTVAITGFSGVQGFGAGSMGYTLPDGYRGTAVVRDSTGPVLVDVVKFESNGTKKDTALIRFSESMDLGSLAIQNYLEINKGKTMTCQTYEKSDRTTFMITGDLTDLIVGDSLRIRHDRSVKESAGNGVAANNRFCAVRELRRPAKLKPENCWIYDRNADGTPDQISLQFEKGIATDQLESMKFQFNWVGKGGTDIPTEFTGGALAKSGSDRMTISFDKTDIHAGGITENRSAKSLLIQWDEYTESHDTIAVALLDSMAPVIVEARYFGTDIADADSAAIDTLEITFSEPTVFDAANWNRPFACYSPVGDTRYSMELLPQSNGKMVRFAVKNDASSVVPRLGDSIWIDVDQKVTDQNGIGQNNSANRGVLFSECRYSNNYAVDLFPSVFTDRNRENPMAIRYGASGATEGVVAIAVRPLGNRPGGSISGAVTMFDILGNTVVAKTEMMVHDESGALIFTSDMRNLSGRALGTGSYVAIVEVVDESGIAVVYRKVIGVQK